MRAVGARTHLPCSSWPIALRAETIVSKSPPVSCVVWSSMERQLVRTNDLPSLTSHTTPATRFSYGVVSWSPTCKSVYEIPSTLSLSLSLSLYDVPSLNSGSRSRIGRPWSSRSSLWQVAGIVSTHWFGLSQSTHRCTLFVYHSVDQCSARELHPTPDCRGTRRCACRRSQRWWPPRTGAPWRCRRP